MSEKEKLTSGDWYVLGFCAYLLLVVYWAFNAETWDQWLEGVAGLAMIGIIVMVCDSWNNKKKEG